MDEIKIESRTAEAEQALLFFWIFSPLSGKNRRKETKMR